MREVLLTLINRRQDVKIKSLLVGSGVSRSTFYRYLKNKQDLPFDTVIYILNKLGYKVSVFKKVTDPDSDMEGISTFYPKLVK